jgi:hypothetical protein
MGCILLSSCNQFDDFEQIDEVRFSAEYAIPLVDMRVSIHEILNQVKEDATIFVDPDGQIRFQYQGEVITQSSLDLFAAINQSLPPVIPVTSPRMALPFASPDGIEVDRIDLKGGSLTYYFESRLPKPAEVRITMPQVRRNGQPISFRHNLPAYSGSGDPPRATNFFLPADLAGYTIVPEGDSVYIVYEALMNDGAQGQLSNFLVRIENLSFIYAEGYLGNQIHKGGRDTIHIDFFDNWVRGDVYFEEPKVTFRFENSFGIPTRSIVNLFNVVTVQGQVLPLRSGIVEKGIDFPFPSMQEIGKTKHSTFTFTKENSNIDVLLGSGPVAVDYDVDALTNPDNDRDIRGFITDSSYYRVQIVVDLPLYGRAVDFLARDTFALDFSQYGDIRHVEFKMVVDNGLPLDVDVQAYFLDEKGVALDSLFDRRQRLVAAAPVVANGVAEGETRQVTYAPYSAERFSGIRSARALALVAAFSSAGGGDASVRIFAQQGIRVQVGAKLGLGKP